MTLKQSSRDTLNFMEGIILQSKHNRRSKTKLLCKKTFKTKVRVTTKTRPAWAGFKTAEEGRT